jgi:hypothetical protein
VHTRAAAFAVLAILAALIAGCMPQRTDESPLAAPRSEEEWTALVSELRTFERRIGFEPTRNFLEYSPETESFPYCGHVSRLYLPYSYEDPAIRWIAAETEKECRAVAEDADVSFSLSEALGERETPVTASMLSAPLTRFVYLVIHEDCHEQFELPYGIEEALCNVLTFRAMALWAEDKFRSMPRERQAILRFVREGSKDSHTALAFYERLAVLYARHDRSAITPAVLLRERARIFRTAERELAWPKGSMNNVWLANTMTYARHYPVIERVLAALGGDMPRTVAFFREIDAAKPTPDEVVARFGLKDRTGLDFVRANEAALVEAIRQRLPSSPTLLPWGEGRQSPLPLGES